MNFPFNTHSHVPGYPDAYYVLSTTVLDQNPTPESTDDVECPEALPYMLPQQVTPTPTLQELASRDVIFTRGPFPRLQIYTPTLLSGMSGDQAHRVQANPAEFFAVIPHGANDRLLKPALRTSIIDFLTELGFQGRAASINLELPEGIPGPESWALLLSGLNDEMRRFLPWQQTFAVSEELAFHVVPFNARPRLYHPICTLTWNFHVLDGSPATKLKISAAVRAMMWSSPTFLRVNAEIMHNRGLEGTEKYLAIAATVLLDIHYAPPSGNHDAVMILTCRSFAATEMEQGRWTKMFNEEVTDRLIIDGCRLPRGPVWWRCMWCKSFFHHGEDCDFENVPGWLGPTQNNPSRAIAEMWDSDKSFLRARNISTLL
ncbi:hypothetical protein C8F01DRAFT_1229459 [Mycena amicta]|nr:hypothetical protein C8F01DRAFT_1229459 [Mycena amicta]